MVPFNKRTIIGNIYCQRQLIEFRNSVIDYFNNCEYGDYLTRDFSENDKARCLRSTLNRNLLSIQDIVYYADVTSHIIYTPPPIVGGYVQNINLISNIFHLYQYEIEPKYLLDFIDRAIGVYKNDQIKSLLRTFNLFFWIGILLDFIVSAPFKLLGRAGISTKEIEESNLGKIAKLILYITSLAAGVVSIAQPLGWLDHLKKMIGL